jgi:hypothetical protein
LINTSPSGRISVLQVSILRSNTAGDTSYILSALNVFGSMGKIFLAFFMLLSFASNNNRLTGPGELLLSEQG